MDVQGWLEKQGLGALGAEFPPGSLDDLPLEELQARLISDLSLRLRQDRPRFLEFVNQVMALPAQGGGPAGLERLPSLLALPLKEYFAEDANPVLKLWHACHVVEVVLRLAVGLGVSDLLRSGRLPENLVKALDSRIEAPTLGKWSGMAQEVAKALRSQGTRFPQVPVLVDEIIRLLGEEIPQEQRTPQNAFSSLRNLLAHGGAPTRAQGADLIQHWRAPVDALVGRLEWLEDVHFVVRDG